MSKIGLVYTTFYLSWSGVELLSGGGVGWGVKSIFFVKPTYSWAELGFWQLTQVTQVNLGGISLLRCSGYLLCPTVGTAEVYLTFYLVWNLTWWPLAIVSRTSSWENDTRAFLNYFHTLPTPGSDMTSTTAIRGTRISMLLGISLSKMISPSLSKIIST